MDPSFDEYLSSSQRILRSKCRNDLQLCANAAQAIPSSYGTVDEGVQDYAGRLGVSKKTVSTWRETGLKWSRVMPEFPPKGELAKVDYCVYRDLPAKFGGDMDAALAFLQALVDEKPLPAQGRWTRGAVFTALPPTAPGSRGTTSGGSGSGKGGDRKTKTPAGLPVTPPPGLLDPKALAERLNVQVRAANLGTDGQVRVYLEAALDTLSGLDDGPEKKRYLKVERSVKAALAALAVAEQLAIEV